MDLSQQQALLSLALHAAYVDGTASAAEKESVSRMVKRFEQQGVELPSLDPAVRDRTIGELATRLRGPETAAVAYEMAASVCEADKSFTPQELEFLARLRVDLGLEESVTQGIERQAVELAEAPRIPHSALAAVSAPPVLPPVAPAVAPVGSRTDRSREEIDRLILNQAILAGALELLPNSLATMAIIPVQMRLVYKVGRLHGYELDSGHIKDFLATLGVGLTSQVVEGLVERLARGVFGKVAGGLGRSLGGQLASSGLSFATTYALGQLARQYYAGGRKLSSIELRQLFESLTGQGHTLQNQYLSQIREQAGRLNLTSLPALLRN